MMTFACRQKEGDDHLPPSDVKPDKTTSGLNLTYANKFAEILGDIVIDSNGNTWVSRSSKANPEAKVTSTIEKRDLEGNLSGEVIDLGETLIAGFAPLSDGSLVVAEYTDSNAEGLTGYSLKFITFDSSAQVIFEKEFAGFEFQQPSGYEACSPGTAGRIFFGVDSVQLVALDDDVVVQTYNCRYTRLSRLSRDLRVIWSKEVSSQRYDFGAFYGHEALRVTSQGTIFSSSMINANEVAEFNRRFGDDLRSKGDADVLVSAYSQDGARLFSGIVGTDKYDSCTAFAVRGESILFAAETKVDRPTSVRDFQSDVWVAAYDISKRELAWSKIIDVQDEETVHSIAAVGDNLIAVGGSAGSLQVPTRSVVKHGDAFVLLTDLHGNVVGKTTFGTARADYVSSILPVGTDKILVGGGKDGPITHDGDADKTQLHRFAFIDTLLLQDIIGK